MRANTTAAATTTAGRPAPLVRALDSARLGRYADARGALDELGGDSSDDPVVQDLLARLHAQRGELAEADACWARVLASAPADAPVAVAAVAGRRRIAALQARRYRPTAGRRWGVAVVVLATAGAVVAGVLLPVAADPAPPDPAVGRRLAAVQREQRDLAGRLDTLRAQLPPAVVDLSGPGTTVTRQGDGQLITFDEGLFGQDATLTPAGTEALRALGDRLASAGASGPLVITGHTDDTPLPPDSPYPDRINLGFTRAQTAAEALSDGSGIPLTAIGIRSTGTARPPFPDDSTANRARNRARNNTVTVLVGQP